MVSVKDRWVLITGTSRGIVEGLFIDDKRSGRKLGAQNFAGMTLEAAVKKAEEEFKSPY